MIAEDVISAKWALPVIRVLLGGPCRFSELKRSIPAISAKILTERLREFELLEIVKQNRLPHPVNVSVYFLTQRGSAAGQIIEAVDRWNLILEQIPAYSDRTPSI